jgi:tRNA A37 threonylcarbamoyladenosine modification protein TsaB
MILFIDTSDLNKAKFALISEKTVKSKTIKILYHENYKTLEHLEKFLQGNKIKLHQISATGKSKAHPLSTFNFQLLTSIIICSGPGSFTGLRVSASLAQALGFALGIPFAAIKKSRVPKNLRDLTKIKSLKKITLDYGRPAI